MSTMGTLRTERESLATVSSVINNSRPVSEDQETGESAIQTLNYVPSRAARSLKRGRAGLSSVVPTVTNVVFGHLFENPNPARQHGYA